jgi:hypothetical protein
LCFAISFASSVRTEFSFFLALGFLETIGIHTERRGEARNLMSRKSREINMDYEKRLKN